MRKYAWLLTMALLAALALLTACSGEAVPSTPRSTITPTSIPPVATTTTATPTQTGGIPAIPHAIKTRENCLVCHETGIAGSVAIPADHAGRDNDTCTTCHQVATTVTPTETATPTTTTPTTTTATTTPTAGGPPPVPHDIAGHEDCVLCHETGIAGAPAYPSDHAGRTNDSCTACHEAPATATPPPTTTTTTATPTTTTPTTTTPTETTGGIPQIPHFTDGFESCLTCHADGIGGAPAVPADHAGRADDTCAVCHTPAASRITLQYPIIEHGLDGRENCLMCHETGVAGAPAYPSDHAGRTNDSCVVCHKTGAGE
jgi:hypothetical protein